MADEDLWPLRRGDCDDLIRRSGAGAVGANSEVGSLERVGCAIPHCLGKKCLKDLKGTTHINKMHLLFGSSSDENSKVKRAWLRAI